MLENTCQDCEERAVGCHSTCQRYLKAKMKHDLVNKKLQAYRQTFIAHATFKKDLTQGNVRMEVSDSRRGKRKNWIPNEGLADKER